MYTSRSSNTSANQANSTNIWVKITYGPTNTANIDEDLIYTNKKSIQRFNLYEVPSCPSSQNVK
jgi:hypothetical protein